MVSEVLFSSKTSEWITPKKLFDQLNKEFNFDLDPCTTKDNPLKVPNFFTKEDDGLEQSWIGYKNIFINPPYNREIEKWLYKAINEFYDGGGIENIVFLLPSRTDTKWFHDYIYNPYPFSSTDRNPKIDIRFLKGRLKFENAKNSAPFPSMVVVFSKCQDLI